MVTNPLRIIQSRQPSVHKTRLRASSITNTFSPEISDMRSSISENLKGNRKELPHQTATLGRHCLIRSNSAFSDHQFSKEENPIPLPPRDKNKQLLTAKPRHTRKHPLIIPPTSFQTTLDKVNSVSKSEVSLTNPFVKPKFSEDLYTNDEHYLEAKHTESINFEEQIDSNLNALDEIHPESDVTDGVCKNFEKNDVSDDSLSHHVSCEDLLKFANTKPSSRTRGNDSDEVRIMSKVLGRNVTTEKCLEALDHSDWDVMRAIKVLKLQNVVIADLMTCYDALENSSWDVAKAAQLILQQDGEVTQV
ncbi:hypothetical protein HHI36_004794 [Cryptolaemus montrouzieri]|uniref:Uncharacterized protein n=1 Tax=Cryptolaemus montrouzieri TaxID=559131 RepID=A0ABD2NS80_9CUCU